MARFERLEWKKRRPIPVWLKLILMIAIVFGIATRKCWKKTQVNEIVISNIEITEITTASIDVSYNVGNLASIPLKKSFIIKVFTKDGEELASKITQNEIPARTNKRYLKLLQKFNFPLKSKDDVSHATVQIYSNDFM